MRQCALVTEPPYTERYVRWCERTASQIMGGLLLDLTLGFVFVLALSSPAACAAGTVWRGKHAPRRSTLLPTRRKIARRPTSGVTTSRIAQIRKTLIWLPGRLGEGGFKGAKSQFIFSPQSRKSAFRSANNEITEGLPSGGALMCGEHWQALGYEVSRAYKRRFTPCWPIDAPP